jgi:hypothetical protein
MAVEEAAEDVGLERRLANALWDSFFGREITAGYYRSLTDVSPATATKDLAVAVAAGLLASEGERRGRRYFAGTRLYPAVSIRGASNSRAMPASPVHRHGGTTPCHAAVGGTGATVHSALSSFRILSASIHRSVPGSIHPPLDV